MYIKGGTMTDITIPIKVSRGCILNRVNKKVIVYKYHLDEKVKTKEFRYSKKRTMNEAIKLAEEYKKSIDEQYKLWMDYITPIRKEKKKATARALSNEYRKKPEVKEKRRAYLKEYYKKPEIQLKRKEYNKKPEVKLKKNTKRTEQRRIAKRTTHV